MKKPRVNVYVILDRSSSMQSCQFATQSGFNEYVEKLKQDKKTDYRLWLTQFNESVEKTYEGVKLDGVELNYQPNGMTALYDAVCGTLKGIEDAKAKSIVVIMTDGEENSSKEFKQADMNALIKKLEAKKNWTFVYLGANQDAIKTAVSFGISAGNAATFNSTTGGMGATFKAMATSTMIFANASPATTSNYFSSAQQDEIQSAK